MRTRLRSDGIRKHFVNSITLRRVEISQRMSLNKRSLIVLISLIFKRESFLSTCSRTFQHLQIPRSGTQCRLSFSPALRQLSELVLKRIAAGVPGFSVNDVAFDQKMKVDEVASQLRGYVEEKGVERADEVALGTVRKLRFEQSIERIPETFFDLSPYVSRLTTGAGDCAVIATAVAERADVFGRCCCTF